MLLSAFDDSAVSNAVLDVGLVGFDAEREWREPALAALVFSDRIGRTLRPWELVPEGETAAVDRTYEAIARGTVLMGHPFVFAESRGLWMLWEGSLRCVYGTLDELLGTFERSLGE